MRKPCNLIWGRLCLLFTGIHCYFLLNQTYWKSAKEEQCPKTVQEALKKCDRVVFPNLHRLLQLLCVYPVTSSESERTFSALKRLKNYLRSTMLEDRLNGLALMYVHRNISVSEEDCITDFADKHPRKMKFYIT